MGVAYSVVCCLKRSLPPSGKQRLNQGAGLLNEEVLNARKNQ